MPLTPSNDAAVNFKAMKNPKTMSIKVKVCNLNTTKDDSYHISKSDRISSKRK